VAAVVVERLGEGVCLKSFGEVLVKVVLEVLEDWIASALVLEAFGLDWI